MGVLDSYLEEKGLNVPVEEPKAVEPKAVEPKKTKAKPKKKVEKVEPVKGTGISVNVTKQEVATVTSRLTTDIILQAINTSDDVPVINEHLISDILDRLPISRIKVEHKVKDFYGEVVTGKDDNMKLFDEPIYLVFASAWKQYSISTKEGLKELCASADGKTGYGGKKCAGCLDSDSCKINTTAFFLNQEGKLFFATFRGGFGTTNLSKLNSGGKRWLKLLPQPVKYNSYDFFVFDIEEIDQLDIPTAEGFRYAADLIARHLNNNAKRIANS